MTEDELLAEFRASGALPGGRADIGVPLIALGTLDIPTFPPGQLPEELRAIPAEKPGSRGMR